MVRPSPRIFLSGEDGFLTNYIRAVRAAGGTPVFGCCTEMALTCAGLLLCGGGDLDPALFGQESRGAQPPDPLRDRRELGLVRAFLAAGTPILGLCRGLQVLNVALGGSLIQDLPPDQRPFHTGPGGDRVHPVRAAEGSLLARLYGPVFPVNSSHHQAVDRPGHGLVPTLWSEGGVVEALAHPVLPVLGVQFHPERMSGALRRSDTVDGGPILDWFLAQCR